MARRERDSPPSDADLDVDSLRGDSMADNEALGVAGRQAQQGAEGGILIGLDAFLKSGPPPGCQARWEGRRKNALTSAGRTFTF